MFFWRHPVSSPGVEIFSEGRRRMSQQKRFARLTSVLIIRHFSQTSLVSLAINRILQPALIVYICNRQNFKQKLVFLNFTLNRSPCLAQHFFDCQLRRTISHCVYHLCHFPVSHECRMQKTYVSAIRNQYNIPCWLALDVQALSVHVHLSTVALLLPVRLRHCKLDVSSELWLPVVWTTRREDPPSLQEDRLERTRLYTFRVRYLLTKLTLRA